MAALAGLQLRGHRSFGRIVSCVGLAVLFAVLALAVLYPMAWALIGSLQTDMGEWTLRHYQRVFSPYYLRVMGNTLSYAALSTGLALAIAVPLAWLVARTDMPGKAWIRAGVTVTFVMPPLFHALAFVFLFQPRAGVVNTLLQSLIGLRPFNIYTLAGLVSVTAFGIFPQMFLLLDGALRSVDPSLEEAACVTGASPFRIARSIVMPAVLPALLSSAVLGMVEVMALFGPPAVIGIPAKFYVMSTQIFVELAASPPRMEFSAALAILFLIVTTALLLLQDRLLRRRSFATITGKGFRPRAMRLGRWRQPVLAGSLGVLVVALIVPTLMLIAISVSNVWTDGPVAGNLTLRFYRAALFGEPDTFISLTNTLVIAFATLTATSLVGLPIAWITTRQHGPVARALRLIAYLPFSVPAIVFTVGVVLAFIRPPLVLYGTLSIIIICYFARFLPLAVQPLSDALRQIDPSLTEAARVVGGGTLRIGVRVVLPLVKYASLSTAMLVFIACVREIVSIALLYSPGTETLMMTAMRLWEEGQVQITAALVVVILGVVTVFYGVARVLVRPRGV